MAKIHGKNAVLFVSDGTTEQNLKGDGNTITLNLTGTTAETLAFGDTWITRIAGHKDWSLDYSGFFNTTASTAQDTVYAVLNTATCIVFFPSGCPVGTGSPRFKSSAGIITDFSVTTPVDGPIALSFTMIGASDINRTIV